MGRPGAGLEGFEGTGLCVLSMTAPPSRARWTGGRPSSTPSSMVHCRLPASSRVWSVGFTGTGNAREGYRQREPGELHLDRRWETRDGPEFVPNRLESGGASIIGQKCPNAARTRRDDLWTEGDAPLPEDAPPGNDEQWSSGLTGCPSVSSPAAVSDRSRLESRWRRTKTGFSRGKRDGSQPSTWQSMTEPAGITSLVGTREGRLCTPGDRGEHNARRAWLSTY
ncbi:hypothetical protein V8D89_008786 [Ganoderma adspersum]